MASAPPKIVCVIGMHRSGTSAVMRLLNLAGLDLGDDGSLELKGPDNPTGYWELRALREINDELLARWNATWSDPPNPDWIHASEIADLRARARETLSNLQSGTGPWGWKDPRTSVTLPFWKELLPRQVYVLCVRNPLSVAASLKARDGMPLEHALNLWSEYTGAALEYTQAEHRVIVNYESMMTNWKSTLRRIVENLGLADLEPPESIEEQVESFLQPQLSHYNYALEDVLDTPSLDFISKSLYCFLREEEGIATESEWAAAIRTAVAYRRREIVAGHALQHAEPDQTRRNHRVLSEELGDLRARARRDVSNLTRELVQAHNERDLSLLRQGSLEERVRSSEDALEELRANHSRLGTDYEKALEHGRTLEERVRSSEDALEELRANHSRLGTDYEKALEHGRTLEERVRSSEDALEELRANHSRLGTDYEKALEHGRTLEERVRSSEDALEELRANHSRLGTDYEKALEHGRTLEERVRSSEDALEELRANHSRLGTDYEKALEHGRTLEERVRSSEDALEELRANHSRLGTDYEKALEHGRTLEERVRSSEDALEELRANHSRLGTDYEKALEHGRTLSAEKEAQQARIIKYMASTSQLRNSRSALQREHQLLVNQYGALQNEARRLHEGATSVLPLLSHLVWLSGRAVFRAIPMGARLRGYAKNSFYGAYGALRRNSPRVLEYREALRSEGRQNVTASADPLTRMETSPSNSFDVIVFPIIDWDFRRQRPQHLATQLANRGHRVLYVATTFASSLEHYEQKPRYVGPNIWVLQLPCPGTPLIYKDVPSLQQVESMYRAIERLRHDLHLGATVSLLNHPFWHPLAQKLSNNLVVYDCFDHHAGFSDTSPQILELESTLLKEADLVLCSAKKLLNRATEVAKKTLLVQNGADYEHFAVATRHAPPEKQRPIVGYFGAIADWFDGELVAEAALGFPDCQFVLVGSTFRAEISTLRMLPNVTFVGEVPYEELPTYLESFDVCLIPFKDLELTRATNPVKIYEYLSAGKPVVAVRLPELEPISDLVYLAETREEFKKCLYQALEEAPDTRLEERQAYARENTWEKRAELLEEELEKLFPLVSVIVLTYGHLDMTKACISSLDQLTDYPNWELIVVDNASTDGTPGFLREYAHERENVTLVLNDENLGFSAGNNRGATAAAGDYLVFLNNDTYVTQGWIGDLLAHFRDSPQLGVLGPVTNNIGNEARIQIQYSDMQTMAQAARDYTESHRGQRIPLRSAAFFCVMIPRTVWEEVGELDEGYEVGFFEDDDYANRVRKARYDISCAEDVFVHHHLSASFSALGELEKQRLFEKNRAYYESKWGPWIRHEYRKPE